MKGVNIKLNGKTPDILDGKLDFYLNGKINICNKILQPKIIINGEYKHPFKGKVHEGYSIFSIGQSDTIIEAYNNLNVLQDKCKTDSDGNYVLFLASGIYKIIIRNSRYEKEFNNVTVTDGIVPYWTDVDNIMILQQYDDVFDILQDDDIYNTDNNIMEGPLKYKLISGQIINQYGEPVSNCAVIITSNNELKNYIITDKNGKYRFILSPGLYNIKIKSGKYPLISFNNFKFEQHKGFFSELAKLSSLLDFNNNKIIMR